MKKARKFIYPFFFSLAFYLAFIVLALLINAFVTGDGYGGLGLFFIFLLAWCYLLVPLYCVKYTKLIKEEKLKYFYAAYNFVILSAIHTAGFIFNEDAFIFGLAFIAWVAIWTFVPLALRVAARKKKESEEVKQQDAQEKPCCETYRFLQNKKRRIIAICFSGLYLTSLVFSSEFFSMLTFQNSRYVLSLIPIIAIFIFLILANKSYPLKNLLLPIAFGVKLTGNLYTICSALFSSYVRFAGTLSLIISCVLSLILGAMFVGTILKEKGLFLLKYGALSCALITTVNYIRTLISWSAEFEGTLDLNFFWLHRDMFLQPILIVTFYIGLFILFQTKKTVCEIEI